MLLCLAGWVFLRSPFCCSFSPAQVGRSCSSSISWWAAFPRDVQIIFISVFTHSSDKNQHFWASLGACTPPGLALLCVALSLQQPLSEFGKTRPSPSMLFLKHPFSRPSKSAEELGLCFQQPPRVIPDLQGQEGMRQ